MLWGWKYPCVEGGTDDEGNVASYKNHLVENRYAISIINREVISLRAWNEFLLERGLTGERVVSLKSDRIKVATGSESEVEVFSDREVNQLLLLAKDRTRSSLRNHVILSLLLYTGVRVGELWGDPAH